MESQNSGKTLKRNKIVNNATEKQRKFALPEGTLKGGVSEEGCTDLQTKFDSETLDSG